jgi:hypothetical protein
MERAVDLDVDAGISRVGALVGKAADATGQMTGFCHGSLGAREISSGLTPEVVNISFQTLEEGLMPNVGTTPGRC